MIFKDLAKIDRSKWDEWFTVAVSVDPVARYGHTLLEGTDDVDLKDLIEHFRPYVNKAHQDARNHFLDEFSIDLHPISSVRYPNDLPLKQHKGYFGEVFCGILTKHFKTICGNDWSIPAFLFRYHDAAGEYLFRLKNSEKVSNTVAGRTGSDFIAIAIDDISNEVISVISGEAKCHTKMNKTVVNKALKKMSEESSTPVSLKRVGKLLVALHGADYQSVAEKLTAASFAKGEEVIPRTDLFLFLFEKPSSKGLTQIQQKSKPASHTAKRPLQVFEVKLKGAEQVIEDLYKGME